MIRIIAKVLGISLWVIPFGIVSIVALGFLLKKSKSVNNELIPISIVGFSCVVCGIVAYIFKGNITEAILKYGLGLGFILTGVSTGGYSTVHGVFKFLEGLKKKDEVSEVKMNKKLLLKKWHDKLIIKTISIVGVAFIVYGLCRIGAALGVPLTGQAVLAWCFAFCEGALIFVLLEEIVSKKKYRPTVINKKYYIIAYVLAWLFTALIFTAFIVTNLVAVLTFAVLSIIVLFIFLKVVNAKYLDWYANTREGADEALNFGWMFWKGSTREQAIEDLSSLLIDNNCYLEKPIPEARMDRQHKIAESGSGINRANVEEYVKGVLAKYSFREETKTGDKK